MPPSTTAMIVPARRFVASTVVRYTPVGPLMNRPGSRRTRVAASAGSVAHPSAAVRSWTRARRGRAASRGRRTGCRGHRRRRPGPARTRAGGRGRARTRPSARCDRRAPGHRGRSKRRTRGYRRAGGRPRPIRLEPDGRLVELVVGQPELVRAEAAQDRRRLAGVRGRAAEEHALGLDTGPRCPKRDEPLDLLQ